MRQRGRLVSWKDDRGFGFIKPDVGGDQLFVHIRALPNRRRPPTLGVEVSYRVSHDGQGRARAEDIKWVKVGVDFGPAGKAQLVSGIFLAVVASLAVLNKLPFLVFWLYVGLSLLTYGAYWWDKAAASKAAQRTPESTLHLLSLIGGWPGALMAQQRLRHKSVKQPFRAVFWLTVALNIAALGYLLSDSDANLFGPLGRPSTFQTNGPTP